MGKATGSHGTLPDKRQGIETLSDPNQIINLCTSHIFNILNEIYIYMHTCISVCTCAYIFIYMNFDID